MDKDIYIYIYLACLLAKGRNHGNVDSRDAHTFYFLCLLFSDIGIEIDTDR